MPESLSFTDLSVTQSPALATALSTALIAGADIVIEGGDIAKIDAAGLQVLLSAHRSAAARGAQIRVNVPMDGLLGRALDTYGLVSPDGVPSAPFHPAQ